jgi:glycerol-3-phosphate O-acyltransferase
VIEDPGLLLYYQNRLVPFAEDIVGSDPEDQRAAREIAALGGGR